MEWGRLGFVFAIYNSTFAVSGAIASKCVIHVTLQF